MARCRRKAKYGEPELYKARATKCPTATNANRARQAGKAQRVCKGKANEPGVNACERTKNAVAKYKMRNVAKAT